MNNNVYMNEYMKARWERRRKQAVEYLGGKCVKCGSEDELEFDHIDPSTKTYTVASASSRNEVVFWAEVDKCQLLCKPHHVEKTTLENGVEHGGGVSGKKNCKCQPCKNRKNEYMRTWKKTKRLAGVS
jgi:hypothetical protein